MIYVYQRQNKRLIPMNYSINTTLAPTPHQLSEIDESFNKRNRNILFIGMSLIILLGLALTIFSQYKIKRRHYREINRRRNTNNIIEIDQIQRVEVITEATVIEIQPSIQGDERVQAIPVISH